MVICKYFLRGTCRFGENCKNEHSYNENTSSILRKKTDVDPNVIIKAVSNDMDKAEKGNQWPLSCYGPFQGKPCFPGFEEKSFEEIRLGMYDAEKNGTSEQYKQHLTQLLLEARMKMRYLQNPTAEATHILKELFNSNSSETQTSNLFTNNTNPSPFNSNVVSTTSNSPSIFGNTAGPSKSIFGAQPATTNPASNFSFALPENKSNNIFGNVPNTQISNSGNIFAQTNQQSGNIFGGATAQNQSQGMFSSPNQQQNFGTNLFQSNNQPNQNIFGNSPLANNPPPFGAPPNASIFQTQPSNNANIFNQNQPASSANIFNQTQQNAAGNVFNQNQVTSSSNVFVQSQPNSANIFNQNQPSTTGNMFTQSQPIFAQNQPSSGNIFAQNQANIFAQAPPPAATSSNLFAQSTPPPNPFQQQNQAAFVPSFAAAAVPETAENRSVFAQPATSVFPQNSVMNSGNSAQDHNRNIFGAPQNFAVKSLQSRSDDPTIYSKLADLSEIDVKCFEASLFEFKCIPVLPPALQMC